VVTVQLQRRRIYKAATRLDNCDTATFRQTSQASRQSTDDLILSSPHLIDVNLRGVTKTYTPMGAKVLDFRDDFCHVQERLAGDTSAQQTRSTQSWLGFDDSDLQTFVGGEKRGGITARTTTEHNNR
jgi:hypothetical protein